MRLRLLLFFFFFGLANGRELVAVVENGTESYNLTTTFRSSRNRNSGKLSVLLRGFHQVRTQRGGGGV